MSLTTPGVGTHTYRCCDIVCPALLMTQATTRANLQKAAYAHSCTPAGLSLPQLPHGVQPFRDIPHSCQYQIRLGCCCPNNCRNRSMRLPGGCLTLRKFLYIFCHMQAIAPIKPPGLLLCHACQHLLQCHHLHCLIVDGGERLLVVQHLQPRVCTTTLM